MSGMLCCVCLGCCVVCVWDVVLCVSGMLCLDVRIVCVCERPTSMALSSFTEIAKSMSRVVPHRGTDFASHSRQHAVCPNE